MKFVYFFLFLGGISAFTAQAEDGSSQTPTEKKEASSLVAVEEPWIRVMKNGKNASVYMTLKTPKGETDVLVGATCAIAKTTELHTHILEDGIMRMRPMEKMEIAGEKTLKPGGDHIMLIGLRRDAKVGQKIPVILRFEKSGEITVLTTVKPAGGYRAHADRKPH